MRVLRSVQSKFFVRSLTFGSGSLAILPWHTCWECDHNDLQSLVTNCKSDETY